eukprot:CFRG5337T1
MDFFTAVNTFSNVVVGATIYTLLACPFLLVLKLLTDYRGVGWTWLVIGTLLSSVPLWLTWASTRPAGLSTRPLKEDKTGKAKRIPHVVIVGAGFAGLCMALKLKSLGVKFTIVEKGDALGGVWAKNTYPGARCDIPSLMYQFSFALNPDWPEKWSKQSSILEYIVGLYRSGGILGSVKFRTEVKKATWIASECVWKVECVERPNGGVRGEEDTNVTIIGDWFIPAVGQLSYPYVPTIKGLRDTFKGEMFHSAEWPTPHMKQEQENSWDGLSSSSDANLDIVRNKRVVVVGAGATAIQCVPEIAKVASHVVVVQRTPSYVLWKQNEVYSDFQKMCFKYVPFLLRVYRYSLWIILEAFFIFGATKGSRLNKLIGEHIGLSQLRHYLSNESKPNASLYKTLKPDYMFMCKRTLFSNDWYPALLRPNVTLVTGGVSEVTDDSIVAADGKKYPADVIICCTGFKATQFMYPMTIIGKGGLRLQDVWGTTPHAYLGMQVSGFPNFAMIYGPNTNLGHNSILLQLECQTEYICKAIAHVASTAGVAAVDIKSEVMTAHVKDITEELNGLVFTGDCNSWYKNTEGKSPTNCSTSTFWYWLRARRFNQDLFEIQTVRDVLMSEKRQL